LLSVGNTQVLDLAHCLEVAHRHRIIRPDDYTVGADDFDEILQSRDGVHDGVEVELLKIFGGLLRNQLFQIATQ
jgi:hypothetical protein